MIRKKVATKVRRKAEFRSTGTHVIKPKGVQERYGVSLATRWRMERDGRLPKRDVFIGGIAVGWKPETLAAAEAGH